MISGVSDLSAGRTGRPVRSAVQIALDSGICAATVTLVHADGVHIESTPGEGAKLALGRIVELSSEIGPLGQIRPGARVDTLHQGTDRSGRQRLFSTLKFVGLFPAQQRILEAWVEAWRPTALFFGFDRTPDRLCLAKEFDVVTAATRDDVFRFMRRDDPAVLLIGDSVASDEVRATFTQLSAEFPDSSTAVVVIGTGPKVQAFQDLIDEDRIFYLSRGPLADTDLCAIVQAARDRFIASPQYRVAGPGDRDLSDDVLDLCVRITDQTDAARASDLLLVAVRELMAVDHAQCLLYDSEHQVLRPADHENAQAESPAAGLVGYIVRTGIGVRLEDVGSDPRYDCESDNPRACGNARFMGEPLRGPGNAVMGVVSAVRSGGEPFSCDESKTLKLLASCTAPVLHVIALRNSARASFAERTQAAGTHPDIFRKEALAYNARQAGQEGDVLRTPPLWLQKTHWIVVAVLFVVAIYLFVARVDEFAAGPAVVEGRNRIAITADSPEVIQSIAVAAGDYVRKGDLLMRVGPDIDTTETPPRQLVAPIAGTVRDLRIQTGQRVSPGDRLVRIVDERAGCDVIARLSGANHAGVRPGMRMVVTLAGHPESPRSYPIDRVDLDRVDTDGAEVDPGGSEPPGATGAVQRGALRPVSRPKGVPAVATVRAALSGADGVPIACQDGVSGEAQAKVGSESVVFALMPSLSTLFSYRKAD